MKLFYFISQINKTRETYSLFDRKKSNKEDKDQAKN